MFGKAAGQKYPYFTHPITWLLMLFLLINQLILSPYFPSFVSGKLSDFALVFLLPLFFIASGSLLPFSRLQKIIPWLGFGMTIFLFGFGKILPSINTFIYQTLSTLLPFNTHFVLDPTDAFALLMLIPSFWVWKQTSSSEMVLSFRWKWIFLPAVLVITLADAAAPNYGITCLENQSDGILLAQTAYYGEPYESSDGGKTWNPADSVRNLSSPCEINTNYSDKQMVFTSSDGLMVKFENSNQILESRDNGKTWNTSYTFDQYSQAEIAYRKHNNSSIDFLPGPLDVVEDLETGNLVAAMGQSGVLVRTQDGVWQPTAVNNYRPLSRLKENGLAGYFFLLWVEWVMCIFEAIFLISLFNLPWRKKWWRIVKVILAWLGWVLIMIMSPAIGDSYLLGFILVFGIPLAALWAIFCLVDDINSWKKPPTRVWSRYIPLAVFAAVTSAVCYLLWGLNVIPSYNLVLGIVMGLTLIFAIIGTIWSGVLRHQEEQNE
ncbi:MAG: hypothetical protein ACYDH1_05440 [Anaerolineaceae bacterium]